MVLKLTAKLRSKTIIVSDGTEILIVDGEEIEEIPDPDPAPDPPPPDPDPDPDPPPPDPDPDPPPVVFDLLNYGPIVWYEIGDVDTITEAGGLVSNIDDKSGNDNHAEQLTEGLKPASGATINALPAINLSGEKRMTLASPVSVVQVFAAIKLQYDADASIALLGAESDGSPEIAFTAETSDGGSNSGSIAETVDGYEDIITNTWYNEYVTENVCLIGYSPFLGAQRGASVIKISTITAIPKETISSATLTWACDWTTYGAYKGFVFRIYAVADPNAADVGSGNLPSAQTLTTAYVEVDTSTWTGYNATGYWEPTAEVIDVSAVLQEYVDHASYEQNDAIQFILQPHTYPSGSAGVSFNSTESALTLLTLDYSAASPPSDSIITFNGSGTAYGYWSVDGSDYATTPDTDTVSDVGSLVGAHIVSAYFAVDGTEGAAETTINLDTFFGRSGLDIPTTPKIAELAWFDRVLSYSEKFAVETYLADKYGVMLIEEATGEEEEGGGGGGGGGGDGDLTLPVITRKTHSQEIFVTPGNTLSVTYVSDIPCMWIAQGGSQFTESISANGLELTLSWNVSASEPGRSNYVGALAWRYGDAVTEVFSEIYDIYHIGKDPADIKTLGLGTAYTELQSGIEQPANAGDTFIIENDTYSGSNDTLMIGFHSGSINSATPNGVSTSEDTVNVIGSDGITVTGTENIKIIDKYTTIISRTPFGAVVDRQYRKNSSRILGEYRDGPNHNSGVRTDTFGIEIVGIAFRNILASPSIERADECHYKWVSMVQDTISSDFDALYSPESPSWMDGAFAGNYTSARKCSFEGVHALGNNRFGFLSGRYSPWTEDATKFCSIKQSIVTSACAHGWNDRITQEYTGYGARHFEYLNCLAIDSSLFKAGLGTKESTGQAVTPDYSFICTNSTGDDHHFEGIAAINGVRGGLRLDTSAAAIHSSIKNAIYWGKDDSYEISMENANRATVENVTMGKNGSWYSGVGSMIANDGTDIDHTNLLIIYPRWDSVTTDKVIYGSAEVGVDDNHVFIPTGETPESAYLANLNNYYEIAGASTISSGGQYLTRAEPGSTIAGYGVGCLDWFAMLGDSGDAYQDGAPTRHDGSGETYKNWLSRMPVHKFKIERNTFSCTRSGIEYTGDVGGFANNVNLIDYINRQGTTPANPINTPFIEDIYVYINASDNPVLVWRPVCPAYRSTITGYDIYVDGVLEVAGVANDIFYYELTSITVGPRSFSIVVKDTTYGDSGSSRSVAITVP